MSTGRIQFAEQDGTFVLKFVGEVRLTLCSALDATIEKIFTAKNFNAMGSGVDGLSEGVSFEDVHPHLL